MIRQNPFKGGMNYSYTLRRRGAIAYMNALYYYGLQVAAKIALALNDPGQAQIYLARAERIRHWFNSYFWDKKLACYRDKRRDYVHHPLDGNVWAILSGIADEAKAKSVLDFIDKNLRLDWGDRQVDRAYIFPQKTPFLQGHNYKNVMPFINAFDVLARYKLGEDDSALNLIRRCWGYMVKNDPNFTTWEWIGKKAEPDFAFTSLAHPWSAGATFILTEYILGIRPLEPGYARYLIEPHPSDLSWAKGAVPTPNGLIQISWKNHKDGFELNLNLPEKGIPVAHIPRKKAEEKIWVNDLLIYEQGKQKENPLAKITGKDSRYWHLSLKKPGKYIIVTKVEDEK